MMTRMIVSAGRVHPGDYLCDRKVWAGSTRSGDGRAVIEIDTYRSPSADPTPIELPADTPVEVKRALSDEDLRAMDDAAVARGRLADDLAQGDFPECETPGCYDVSEIVDGEPTGCCRECADDEAAREVEQLDAAESGEARERELDGFAEWQRSKGLPVTDQIDGYEVLREGENEIQRECEFPGGAFGKAAEDEAVRCWLEDLKD